MGTQDLLRRDLLELFMRWLLLLVVWSGTSTLQAQSYAKTKKKAVSRESLQLWDGSDADVAWVNENTLPKKRPLRTSTPWISFALGGGHRLFHQDDAMQARDENQNILSEGRFLDLIKPLQTVEVRSLVHVLSFLSLGVAYHVDSAQLKINNQSVPIAPQEFTGSIQIGPRFGSVRIYGFYNHVINSRSRQKVNAATLVTDDSTEQAYSVEIKQSGGEAGLGTQIRWGVLGLFAEAIQSTGRTFELNIIPEDGSSTFHAIAKPSYQAWQLGLSLDF